MNLPEMFTPLAPLVSPLAGSCASGIVPVIFAAATELALAATPALPANTAYGVGVSRCRGVSTVNAPPPFVRTPAHPYVVANRLVRASYVSCQSVLADQGFIPEHVPVTVSVTTGRPARWSTPLGDYLYRHLQPRLFFGYGLVGVGGARQALEAVPEKALLDLIYLETQADSRVGLAALRLQNMEGLDLSRLVELADRSGVPKLKRAAARVVRLAAAERDAFESM